MELALGRARFPHAFTGDVWPLGTRGICFPFSVPYEHENVIFTSTLNPSSLVLPPPLAGDLRDVGARQHHGDELHEAEDDADHGVHDHHGDHVGLELVLWAESLSGIGITQQNVSAVLL